MVDRRLQAFALGMYLAVQVHVAHAAWPSVQNLVMPTSHLHAADIVARMSGPAMPCFAAALDELSASCSQLSDQARREYAVRLTGCHVLASGREASWPAQCPPIPAGSSKQPPQQQQQQQQQAQTAGHWDPAACTRNMSENLFTVFTELYSDAIQVCYFTSSEAWQARTAAQLAVMHDGSRALADVVQDVASAQQRIYEQQRLSLHAADVIDQTLRSVERYAAALLEAQGWLVEQVQGAYTVLLYLVVFPLAWFSTAFQRTEAARAPMVLLAIVGVAGELQVTRWWVAAGKRTLVWQLGTVASMFRGPAGLGVDLDLAGWTWHGRMDLQGVLRWWRYFMLAAMLTTWLVAWWTWRDHAQAAHAQICALRADLHAALLLQKERPKQRARSASRTRPALCDGPGEGPALLSSMAGVDSQAESEGSEWLSVGDDLPAHPLLRQLVPAPCVGSSESSDSGSDSEAEPGYRATPRVCPPRTAALRARAAWRSEPGLAADLARPAQAVKQAELMLLSTVMSSTHRVWQWESLYLRDPAP